MCIDVLLGLMCDVALARVCMYVCMYVCVCVCVMSTDNDIGVKGATALSQCLPHLTQLTHLNLSSECVHC